MRSVNGRLVVWTFALTAIAAAGGTADLYRGGDVGWNARHALGAPSTDVGWNSVGAVARPSGTAA